MSAPVTWKSLLDPDKPSVLAQIPPANGWRVALGVLAVVLLIGGIITTAVGLGTIGHFEATLLGQDRDFDTAVATAIIGGAAIVLSLLVGTVWLAIGAITWRRAS